MLGGTSECRSGWRFRSCEDGRVTRAWHTSRLTENSPGLKGKTGEVTCKLTTTQSPTARGSVTERGSSGLGRYSAANAGGPHQLTPSLICETRHSGPFEQ